MKQYAVIVHEALKESGINFVAYSGLPARRILVAFRRKSHFPLSLSA
jgi:hypothetical protein